MITKALQYCAINPPYGQEKEVVSPKILEIKGYKDILDAEINTHPEREDLDGAELRETIHKISILLLMII